MDIEKVTFSNNNGIPLSGRIYRKSQDQTEGMIFCHGLFSSKDGYKITQLADSITETGLCLLTFDFSFSGESGKNISEISLLQEVQDLTSAVDFFRKKGIMKIHLMGSSMGGVISLVYASQAGNLIKSIITIATPVNLTDLFLKNNQIDLKNTDPNKMTGIEGIPIRNRFFIELAEIDMTSAIKQIKCPVLIIHGARDSIVSVSDSDIITTNLKTQNKTVIIENGDHMLTRDSDLQILKDNINKWIKGNCTAVSPENDK